MFDQALTRFERRMDQATWTAAPRIAAPRTASPPDRRPAGFMNQSARDAFNRASAFAGPTAKHISSARSAAGRRAQAHRDRHR